MPSLLLGGGRSGSNWNGGRDQIGTVAAIRLECPAALRWNSQFTTFFGDVTGERTFFEHGIDTAALKHLHSIGVLKSVPAATPLRRPPSVKKVRP